jgi:hypothetical protein
MDQTMTQLLANQLGLAPEDGRLQPSDIAAALANKTSDPILALLLNQIASRAPEAESGALNSNHPNRQREIIRLNKMIARLRRQIASAEGMARYIADTFGACPACWGLNRYCEQCQGQGSPGYANPNLEELRTWLEPALKKGGFHIVPLGKS